MAIIRVGAATEVEMIEKKHRIEDALEAVRSAQLEGIVPGGGVALVRAIQRKRLGKVMKLCFYSSEEAIRQMAMNAGENPDVIYDKVSSRKIRAKFQDGGLVSMYDAGIIDPVKVTNIVGQRSFRSRHTYY